MDIENLAKELILKNMTPEQQMAVLESVRQSVANAKEVQKKKIGENVDLVVQALKKIEADIRDRFDAVGNTIEKRVLSIKDGRDGANGTDGRDGKDGKSGRDGLKGDKGADGQAGRDGENGVDGVSVTNAHIDFDGSLVISLSDGRELNVGEVVSQDIAEKIKVISTMSTNAAIAVKEEGTTLTNGVKSINFVGTGITATTTGDDVTVTVASGSGTVTSVAATVPAFLSVTGSPITTTGTLAIGLSGTALPVLNGGTGVTTSTGTGNNVLSISPTLTTLNASGTTTLSGNQIISVTDNSNAALRITQLGSGNALLVEDSSNPDATPFVIDASGQVVIGNDTALTYSSGLVPQLQVNKAGAEQMGISRFSADAGSNAFLFLKSRGATIGAFDVVSSGDGLGTVSWYGTDGTAGIQAASISVAVDGTPSTNDMPGRLVFSTTADGASTVTERMRITSTGAIAFNGASNYGTSGQVLTSAGNAAPTWSTISGSNFASQTANFILAAPNGSAGVPTFRAVVAADIPTLNQNTTGSAATLTTGRTIAITGDLAYTSPSFDGSTNVTAAGTLATVNSNVGSFTAANITVNAKGLITAVSSGTAGASISNDTSTSSYLYPLFASATSGTPTTFNTSYFEGTLDTPAAWTKVTISGTSYWMPLFQ
jgi:hypothetical protein